MLQEIGQILSQSFGKLRIKSALNPILWLCGIVVIPSIWMASRQEGGLPVWLIVLIFLPVSVAVLGFLVLLFFDRDKLQSEDYQIRKQSLELIQEKGDPVPVRATSIDAITNPGRPRLDNKDERGSAP